MTERIDSRAVTLLLLGLCSLIGSGIFFASIPATLSEARAVADANVCPDSARQWPSRPKTAGASRPRTSAAPSPTSSALD
jgi:hypothetical protein